MYEIEKVEQFQMYGIIFSYMSIVISFSTDIANTGLSHAPHIPLTWFLLENSSGYLTWKLLMTKHVKTSLCFTLHNS